MSKGVTVVGAGLAGCEAAHQISKYGINVSLYEMKPHYKSPAHKSDYFAELVCSNSLKSELPYSASGLLKDELRLLGSLIMEAADIARVPAGNALAVDRDVFSAYITDKIRENPYINIVNERVDDIPSQRPVIIAVGPLPSEEILKSITEITGSDNLYFFDSSAPVFYYDSLDLNNTFRQSRYDKGGDDYINCPLDKEEYYNFVAELKSAETIPFKEFEKEIYYENCMPIEALAARGDDTLRFGPMKPVGLIDPETGKRPFACVQLRRENIEGTLYSPVGFQTKMLIPEQRRVFSLIPGLRNGRFARYGGMHKNTYINSPQILDSGYMVKKTPGLYFAGQISGVEGYLESVSSGLVAGIHSALTVKGIKDLPPFPRTTIIGALAHYISSDTNDAKGNFRPMNANMGILTRYSNINEQFKDKRNEILRKRAIDDLNEYVKNIDINL